MDEKWIIPCNLNHFDIEKHFSQTKRVVWRNPFTIKMGDFAYIYLTAPISAIVFRCRVISDKVSDEDLQNNQYAIPKKRSHNYFSKKTKYIIMELDRVYPKGMLTLDKLRLHGLRQVQIQARANRHLFQYLLESDNMLELNNKDGSELS